VVSMMRAASPPSRRWLVSDWRTRFFISSEYRCSSWIARRGGPDRWFTWGGAGTRKMQTRRVWQLIAVTVVAGIALLGAFYLVLILLTPVTLSEFIGEAQ